MNCFADYQEETLRERAAADGQYRDLLFFYAARRHVDQLEALATEIDPRNGRDMLVFELFQGTEPAALVPLADARTEPWVRHALMKAFLQRGATDGALGLWKKCLQWQAPDTLTANLLAQYLLTEGQFKHASKIAAVSLKIAEKQRDVLLWRAMAQSGQLLERALYLDPLPRTQSVTFGITTRDAAGYIDRTLAGIAGQCYPLVEVIAVAEEPGALADDTASRRRLRVIEPPPATCWTAAAAAACKTPLLVTVPPDCTPAADYVRQYALASENAPENLACTGGRIEAFYQEKPGDRWRVARLTDQAPMQRSTVAESIATEALCLDRGAVVALGPEAPSGVTALVRALKDAGRETCYLPEAVAWCLREDSIESALDAYWQFRLPERVRAGDYASAARLVEGLRGLKESMVAFLNDDIDQGNSSLVFPDFLLFFHNALLNLQYGSQRGVLGDGEARVIQDAILDAITPMDQRFKRDLREKVTRMLGNRVITAAPADALPADLDRALRELLDELEALFEAFPQDLYLAIYG